MTSREESTQFSLNELLRIEAERVEGAKQAEVGRRRAAESATREAALRAEAEAKARADAEARSRAETERAERDEHARREAMQRAIIEQARLDVDARTRSEERELERRHELALAALRAEEKRSQLGTILGGTVLGAGLALAVAAAVHFTAIRPAHERRLAELGLAVTAAELRAGDLERRLEASERDAAALRARPTEASPPSPSTPRAPATATPRTPTRRAAPVPTGPDPCVGSRDPLCGLR